MSFIDLMKNDIWSETDITRRTEAMIRAEFSVDAEMILNRKIQGMIAGLYTLTPEEQAEMARFQQLCFYAQQEGVAARADMALLSRVLEYEVAMRDSLRAYEMAVEAGEENPPTPIGPPAPGSEIYELYVLRNGEPS